VLRINSYKTKTISIEQQLHPPIKIGQQDVDYVEHFQYFGSYIFKDGDAIADGRIRIGSAASVFQRLQLIKTSVRQ